MFAFLYELVHERGTHIRGDPCHHGIWVSPVAVEVEVKESDDGTEDYALVAGKLQEGAPARGGHEDVADASQCPD